MDENGQSQLPDTYTLPADLVGQVYRLVGQIASAQAARVFVQLEDEIGRQNDAHRAQAAEKSQGDGPIQPAERAT